LILRRLSKRWSGGLESDDVMFMSYDLVRFGMCCFLRAIYLMNCYGLLSREVRWTLRVENRWANPRKPDDQCSRQAPAALTAPALHSRAFVHGPSVGRLS
jgi:hypothetical protein